MKNASVKITLKLFIYGVLWSILTLAIAGIFTPLTNFFFKDIIFVEGLLMLVISITSAINSKSLGMSFYILNEMHSKYIDNKDFTKEENNIFNTLNNINFHIFLNWISIAIGGFIDILLIFLV
jgi:hypothetical protein